ncbi:MAG: Mut7-C RNAse domain-containing protein [Deltaproteobacteria bacterium]|nr:Mut7-C RNAse domain-containing protein [Deltaproteobacteria bacterium]
MKFIVDTPLGGLAKWLRFCGFDAAVQPLAGGRVGSLPEPRAATRLLTLQKSLGRLHREDIIILSASTPEAQLAEVLQRLNISRRMINPMSRCVKCNEPLRPASREAVAGRVPEYVLHTQKEFYECPACRRLYWPGSHVTGISHKVLEALRRQAPEPSNAACGNQRSGP